MKLSKPHDAKRQAMRSAFSVATVLLCAGGLIYVGTAQANPNGGIVVGGSASLAGQGTSQVTVTQNSQRAAINWDSFSVEAGERTDFIQPSRTSVILNRVTGGSASQIFGAINANGTVILSNRNGVLIGPSGSVNAGSFVATTHDVDTDAFMSGDSRLRFTGAGTGAASIVNEGQITIAEAGLAAFVAPSVRNSGTIVANLGRVALGAGNGFTLDMYGDELVSFELGDRILQTLTLADGTPLKALIEHNGAIEAKGGRIALTAAQAREVVNQSVNVGGLLAADTVREQEGVIILSAHDGAGRSSGSITLEAGAALSAQGQEAGTKGGAVSASAQSITLGSDTVVTADGAAGGGKIEIGGGYQGSGPLLKAERVVQESGSKVTASATASGDGGQVVLWSDVHTQMDGAIEATGIDAGGQVETSSKGALGLSGSVNAASLRGVNGFWLLDPSNVTIGAAGNSVPVGGGITNPSADSYTILASSISAALNAGNNVTITTTNAGGTQAGDITVSSAISKTGGGDATLTLKADNSILVNANITSTSNKLNTILWADSDASSAGAIALNNAQITSNGGNVTLAGGLDNGANGGTAGDGIPDGYAWGTSANDDGISISGSGVRSGDGQILLRGHGQHIPLNSYLYGLDIYGGTVLESTNGNIYLNGIGGNGIHWNIGTLITGAKVSTVSGLISVMGTGGDGSTDGYGYGVELSGSATVASTGVGPSAGTITILGRGAGSSPMAQGLGMYGGNITTVDGAVDISGIVGSSGYGIFYSSTNKIESTGTAPVTIRGQGLGSTDLALAYHAGTTNIIGGALASGPITFIANTINQTQAGSFSVETTGDITIKPRTATTTIGLNGGAGTLGLTSTFLNSLHPGNKLIIGDSAAGTGLVTINGWDLRGKGYDVDVFGGAITFSTNDVLWNGANNLLFAASTGDINIAKSFLKSGGTDSNLTFKASNSILGNTATITSSSNKLNTVLWSDSDASSAGAISLSNVQMTSNGGNVTLAGGFDDGANGGAAGDGVPDGYAWGTAANGHGIYVTGSAGLINTDTGRMALRGHGYNNATSSYRYGVYVKNVLESTSGNIVLDGIGASGLDGNMGITIDGPSARVVSSTGDILLTGTGGNGTSSNFGIWLTASSITQTTGTGASAGNIVLTGFGGIGTTSNLGVGISLSPMISTADGDIGVVGHAGTTGAGIQTYNRGGSILSQGSGGISLTGFGAGGSQDLAFSVGVGYTDIIGGASAAGTITLNANTISGITAGTLSVQTAGDIIVKPRTASTTIGMNGGAGTLGLTSMFLNALHPGNKLIIGDSAGTNTGLVTINGWDLRGQSYNVDVFGGAITFATNDVLWNGANNLLFVASTGDINIVKSFTKSGGADSSLTFKASNSILGSTATIASSSNKLNTVLWSDSDASSAGAISLSNVQMTSNGGDVTLAGGLDNGANGGVSGDGIPDNYAWGTAANDDGIFISGRGFDAGSGNMLLRGHGQNNALLSQQNGVVTSLGVTFLTTSGNISIHGIGGNGDSWNVGAAIGSSSVTTIGGQMLITGTSGPSANSKYGVNLYSSQVRSTGTGPSAGTISFIGNGLSGASGVMIDGSNILTVDGAITAAGSSLSTWNTSSILSTGSAPITFTTLGSINLAHYLAHSTTIGGGLATGDITFASNAFNSAVGTLSIQTDGDIVFKPTTANTTIGLAGAGGGLNLLSEELNALHAGGRVIIGDSTSGLITANAYSWGNNVSLFSGSGVALNGAQTMGAHCFSAQTYGASDITLGASGAVSSAATGDAVVLASNRNFVNNAGAGAVTASNGRWLVYAAGTAGNTYGGMNSGNTALWNTANGAAVSQTGNRYVFAQQPTATLITSNLSKTYGQDLSAAMPTAFTVSGLSAGVANAFLADTASSAFSGAPVLTSLGATSAAHVAGSPYAINLAAGTTSGINGYALAYSSAGQLTVNKAPLTVTANDASKVYGAGNPTYTASYSGFVNGEDTGALTTLPTVQSLAAGAAPHVGTYAITAGGAAASDYLISYLAGTLEVTPASLTIMADNKSKIYGAANPALTASYSGFVNGDTIANITTLPTLSTAAGALSNVGSYAITPAGAMDADYTFAYVNGSLSIAPRVVTVGGSFTAADRIFNGTSGASLLNNVLFLTGVPAGDEGNIALNPVAVFDTVTVGSDKRVSLSLASFLSGSAAGNYTIDLTGAPTTTASITSLPREYTGAIMEAIAGGESPILVPTDYVALGALIGGVSPLPEEMTEKASGSTGHSEPATKAKQDFFVCPPNSKDPHCWSQDE